MKILTLLPFLLLLVACAAGPTPLSPAVTEQPTASRTPVKSATPQAAATGTPTATPKPTRTVTPTITLTLTPTIDTTPTAILATLISTVQPRQTNFRSPDRQWEAQLLTYDCTKIVPDEWYESAYELLQVVHRPDGRSSKVADQLQYCGGIGAYGLAGIVWSPNSRYFYFTPAAYGVPDGDQLGWQRPVWRFDTVTEEIAYVGGPFSPDMQKIAGVQYQKEKWCLPEALIVQTLNGDILASYPTTSQQQDCYPGYGMTSPDYSWRSNIAWAENSQAVAYLEIHCELLDCKSTLYLIDLNKNERQVLLSDHQPAFHEVHWPEPDRLTLIDRDYRSWFYTISTHQLEQQLE